MRRQQETDNDN